MHTFETQLQKRKSDDDKIKNIPALLKIIFRAHRYQLQKRFDTKRRREELGFELDHQHNRKLLNSRNISNIHIFFYNNILFACIAVLT